MEKITAMSKHNFGKQLAGIAKPGASKAAGKTSQAAAPKPSKVNFVALSKGAPAK